MSQITLVEKKEKVNPIEEIKRKQQEVEEVENIFTSPQKSASSQHNEVGRNMTSTFTRPKFKLDLTKVMEYRAQKNKKEEQSTPKFQKKNLESSEKKSCESDGLNFFSLQSL